MFVKSDINVTFVFGHTLEYYCFSRDSSPYESKLLQLNINQLDHQVENVLEYATIAQHAHMIDIVQFQRLHGRPLQP